MAANFDAFEVFPDIVGAVASCSAGIFSWPCVLSTIVVPENPPSAAEGHSRRGERERVEGVRRTEAYRGNTQRFLNSFVRNRYPEISLVTRYMYTHTHTHIREKRERGRQSDSREHMQNGGLKRMKKKKERRARERWRQSIRRVFSMRLERNYFISGR